MASSTPHLCELPGRRPVRGEDGRAVSVRVLVDQLDGLVQGRHADDAEHGAEDLLLVGRHVGRHVRDDGRADKVAVRVLGHVDRAPVQDQVRALGGWGERGEVPDY